MHIDFTRRDVALAAIAALATATASVAPDAAQAQSRPAGKYVSGDFHNHTTCSDGTLSMQKLVKKSTATWGLDWFVQAGHGGNGARNCTLVEDASLATANFPFTNQGPTTTWANSLPGGNSALKGLNASTTGNMWRWQSLQSFQYQVIEDQAVNRNVPLFIGLESVVAGHEHTSMSVITGQMPASIDTRPLNGATLGNANALAQWSYCFDRGDTDNSRGTTNQWNCALTLGDTGDVDGSLYTPPAGTTFDATAKKITTNSGNLGHLKTVEAIKWMAKYHGAGSYYIPAHLERAGPFNPGGNNGFNIEHLRDFNNAASTVSFGFETQPGHGASSERGEYFQCRNGGFSSASPGCNTGVQDTVGGTTYGGTGVYGAQVGGVWDALLGEGRRWWFFASSDWHNRGIFGADDRRSTQDFEPGEYQKTYVLVRNAGGKLRPQTIVDGLRSGNAFSASGQLVDRVSFIACTGRTAAQVAQLALAAAVDNSTVEGQACANMGEKIVIPSGTNVVVGIAVRNPSGPGNNQANVAPYSFPNPSLLQPGVNISQPLNRPVLDHVDLIRGLVNTTPKQPTDADYAGAWPSDWLSRALAGTATVDLANDAVVPRAAKNVSAAVVSTFSAGAGNWQSLVGSDGKTYQVMTYVVQSPSASQYLRLRGSNLPANVPWETDASGNPLPDYHTNTNGGNVQLRIPCTTVGTNVPTLGTRAPSVRVINGCPSHLPVVAGQRMVAYDVAAWADLWFYSNPIYIQVNGSVPVVGVDAAPAPAPKVASVARAAR